ncbi:MAG: nodulation protein NfeD, partial [Dehalococcoidia bacterium]|nr:nodulation protein NfeD [Dehalococcoidia bacterium]
LGVLFSLFPIASAVISAQSQPDTGGVMVGRLDGAVDPVSARILRGWLSDAHEAGAQHYVHELDTPGGDLESMREMVGDILDSPVPIAVLVTPSGSRAASAGTFLVASAHVAAMSPGTTIGAASPVGAGGEELPETIKAKTTQDVAALLRSIANQRDRNSEALVKTITEASSYSEAEALELDILDLLAINVSDLLDQMDGMEVSVQGSIVTLETGGLAVQRAEVSPVQRVLQFLANPTLVFILIALGAILILLEIFIPGGWVAGILGAGLLILAFLGLGSLPVNWIGLVLIGAGLILFFVELQAPGWGGFGLAGGISFILGGFFLFGDTSVPGLPAPDVRVGYGVLGVTAAFMAASLAGLWYFSRKARGITVVSRESQIIGQVGTVRRTLEPRGTVYAAGELWTAESLSGESIEVGESVVVTDMDGVILTVRKEE